jgi:capsular polysaccharide transport system permease protein
LASSQMNYVNLIVYPLRVQIRVIWALILKEVRSQHKEEALGYVWAIIEPLIQMLGWLLFLSVFRQNAPIGSSPIMFLATGMLPIKAFMSISQAMTQAVQRNKQLMGYPIVRPHDTIIAQFILETATDILVMTIIFVVLISTHLADPPHDILQVMEAMVLVIALAFSFGFFSVYIEQVVPIFEKINRLILRLLYFLSGIFFIPDMTPEPLRSYILYNPLAHGVDLFRSAYYSSFESRLPMPSYMIVCAVCLLLVGLMLSSVERAKSRYAS